MPLLGSQALAVSVMKAAEATVIERWRSVALARGGPLRPDEQAQMTTEVREAGVGALFAHMVTNTVVAVAAGPGTIT